MSDTRITYDDLLEFTRDCLVASGSSEKNAQIVAEVLVASDLRGIQSHGVNRLEFYCHEVKQRTINPTGEPRVIKAEAATALVDGDNAQGPVVGRFAMNEAIRKAKESGVGWVVARHTSHYGIAGYYAMMAAEAGCIGLSMTNTSPVCVPPLAKNAATGTNPIACAGPVKDGEPVVIDMATSTVPFGKFEVAMRKGEKVNPGWGVDKDGQPTDDPARVLFGGGVTPLGGTLDMSSHKGFCLGIMVEMLCGVLADAKYGTSVGQVMNPNAIGRKEAANLGQMFVAINPDAFAPGYGERLQHFASQVRGLTPIDAAAPVMMPGDPEAAHARENRVKGIPLHENVVAMLCRLCKRLGVARPKAFEHADESIGADTGAPEEW